MLLQRNRAEILEKTMELIDKYTSGDSPTLKELTEKLEKINQDLDKRLKKIESTIGSGNR